MGKRKQLPARTPEARQNQLISLAVDEVERRLRDGTASSQILVLLLNLATEKAKLELEKLRTDISLSRTKEEEIASAANSAELYEAAINAFKNYHGDHDDD